MRLALLLTLVLSAGLLADTPPARRILIDKTARTLQVLSGDRVLRSYSCVFGTEPLEDKQKEGDHRTPRGKYFVCNKNSKSRYHLFLGLSYPSAEDARRAAAQGRLPAARVAEIVRAERERRFGEWPRRFWYTGLGGEVGIHGLPGADADARVQNDIQKAGDWTWGCISVLNRDIEELFETLPVGTPVEIVK